MDKIENSLQENLNNKILKRYGKCIILWLIAGLLFYSGMKNYCNIEKNNTAVTCLYGNFPDQQKVKEVWESWQKRELITDICFVSNQGMGEVEVSRYVRQKTVQVIGLWGNTYLYDRQCAALGEEDAKGCIIDSETAVALYGSEDCVGSQLTLLDRNYIVRGVASWKQHVIVIWPSEKKTVYTQVLIRPEEGQSTESAASSFLMSNGFSGTVTDDSWIDLLVPVFPAVFLLISGVWLKKQLNGLKKRKIMEILIGGICLFFLWKLLYIPDGWIPDHWSDFSFWTDKIKKERELLGWYLMLPKTMTQAKRLLNAAECMIKCTAAIWLVGVIPGTGNTK